MTFELNVEYKGNLLSFPAEYIPLGYSFKIKVHINGIDIFFERDDLKKYRAISTIEDMEKSKAIDQQLLGTITESLERSL
jgi:hypothetical protein